MTGARRRFGVIVPSVNTVVEDEFASLPDVGANFSYTRVRAERSSDADILRRMGEDLPGAAGMLAHVRPERIVFACTSGSFIGGPNHHDVLAASMRAASSVDSVTTLHCVIDALRALNVERPAIVTPYLEWVTEQEAASLTSHAFDVQGLGSLGITDGNEIAAVTAETILRRAREALTPDADALFLSCTNLPTFRIIERLEEELEVPVVSSNSATAWALLGSHAEMSALGTLFTADRVRGAGS